MQRAHCPADGCEISGLFVPIDIIQHVASFIEFGAERALFARTSKSCLTAARRATKSAPPITILFSLDDLATTLAAPPTSLLALARPKLCPRFTDYVLDTIPLLAAAASPTRVWAVCVPDSAQPPVYKSGRLYCRSHTAKLCNSLPAPHAAAVVLDFTRMSVVVASMVANRVVYSLLAALSGPLHISVLLRTDDPDADDLDYWKLTPLHDPRFTEVVRGVPFLGDPEVFAVVVERHVGTPPPPPPPERELVNARSDIPDHYVYPWIGK